MKTKSAFFFLCRLACCLACCLSLLGCSVVADKPAPERRFFLVEAGAPTKAQCSLPEAALKIRDFRISPGFEERNLVYRTGESSWSSDFHNAFFVDPSAMLAGQTRKWLAESGPFGRVTDLASRLSAAYYLEGSVTTLHGDFRDAAAPKAVLEIQFLLLSGEGSARPLLMRTYRREVSIPDRSPAALAKGYNAALTQVLQGLTVDLDSFCQSAKP